MCSCVIYVHSAKLVSTQNLIFSLLTVCKVGDVLILQYPLCIPHSFLP